MLTLLLINFLLYPYGIRHGNYLLLFLYSCTVRGYNDPNAHYVTLNSTGQGVHYLTADNNAYYVGIDSNNNIQVDAESEFDSVS